MPIDALSVLCAQLTRDLLAIAKFLLAWSQSEFRTQRKSEQIQKVKWPNGKSTYCNTVSDLAT